MKFILRLGGPCCEYPLFKIKLSLGSESFVDLSVNESYKNHAVIITPKEGYSANKMSVTVNGKTITPENGVFSFIMPSGNVNVTVTDTRNDLEKVQDLLTFAGYTTNQGLFTDETYIWMEGTNSSSLKKAIIFADNTNCINVVTAGASGEEVVSQLSSVTKTKDLGQRVTLLRNINSYDYYMPDYVTSFIGESITIIVDPYNGHDFVEIGGIKWATMNIGASQPSDYGLYFAWGDTQGYTAEQVGSGEGQKYFGWADYKYGNGTSSPGATGMTKYNATDGKTVLEASDDAAVANWGGSWRMPTTAEFQALGAAVNTAWTNDYQSTGIKGIICTAKDGSGAQLFFPAAGYCYDGSVENVGDYGLYWSSSLSTSDRLLACLLFFSSSYADWDIGDFRYYGYAVRPVVG